MTQPSNLLIHSVAVATLLGGTSLPIAVSAQDASAQRTAVLEEIIVSSTRRNLTTKTDTPLLETPQNIQVLSASLLEDQGVSLLEDALRNVAGVMPGGYARAYDFYRIRGFEAWQYAYLDGLPRGVALNIEPTALERVEVLKGPSSASYGQGSPGGLVNMVSKRPRQEAFADLDVTVGSYDTYIPTIDIGGAFNEQQTVYGRLNAVYRREGSFIDFTKGVERLFLAPSLTWEIGSQTTLTALGHFSQEWNELIPDQPASGTVLPNPNGRIRRELLIGDPNQPATIDQRFRSLGYEFRHQFNDRLSFHQNARASWVDVDWRNLYQPLALLADQRTLLLFGNGLLEDRSVYTVDNGLNATFDTGGFAHRAAVGVEYYRSKVDAVDTLGFAPLIAFDMFAPDYSVFATPPAMFDLPREAEQDRIGIYLQDEIKLTKRFAVTLGGRWDRVKSGNGTSSETDHSFVPRAGLTYELTPGVMAYASYSESFNPQVGLLDASRNQIEPETGEQWEGGVKLEMLDGRVNSTLAIYQLTRENVATAVPTLPGTYDVSGQQRSRGFEFDGQFQLMPGWEMVVAYAYTEAKVLEDNTIPKDDWTLNVPRNSFSAWMKYAIRGGALEGLGFSIGGSTYSKQAGDVPNTFYLPSYSLVNANVSYHRGRFHTQLNVNNVFDEHYAAGSLTPLYLVAGSPPIAKLTVGWSY